MPLLAIDTSAAISVALLNDDGAGRALAAGQACAVVGQSFHDDQRQHAELLAPIIHNLLVDWALKPSDLTAIAVGTGPGPFTGLRIGLVTAETLAFALGIPVYGVCSLDALAADAALDLKLPVGAEIVATLDARRKELYWARYQIPSPADGSGPVTELTPPQVTTPVALSDQLHGTEVVVGDGALKYGIAGAQNPRFVQASWVGRLALERAAAGIVQPTTPLYLRRPDIQGQAPQAL